MTLIVSIDIAQFDITASLKQTPSSDMLLGVSFYYQWLRASFAVSESFGQIDGLVIDD